MIRILIRKRQEGWQVRFPFGNPWKMPSGEWLPYLEVRDDASAAVISENIVSEYPNADVFTMAPIGEDLGE